MASDTHTLYQPILLSVNNAMPGQKVAIQLSSSGSGTQVAFSSGPVFESMAGIQLTSQSGILPLSQLSMNSSQIATLTAAGGSGSVSTLTLQIQAYLVATLDIRMFCLQSTSDSGIEVTAAVGYGMPQVVNQVPTLFNWYPG